MSSPSIRTLPQRLRELRGHESQASFARKCGITQQNWNRYESGQVEPKASVVRRIALSCGVSTDWVLGEAESQVPPRKIGSVTTREMLAYRQMPTAWLEEEARKTVEAIPPAPRGRGRIGVIGTAIDILVELQERCVDEWTGKQRRPDGTREGDPPPT